MRRKDSVTLRTVMGSRNGVEGNAFSRLKHLSVSDAIATQIHSALLSGKLKPGERITEQDTSRAMGVSRASVREAFQELRASGVVTTVRRRTYISGEPDPEEIRDVYMFRGICEGLAAEEARQNLRAGDFDRLELYLRRMKEAATKRDLEAFWQADLAFHDVIWQANRKAYLQKVLQSITAPLHPFLIALLRRSTPKELGQIAQVHRDQFEELRKSKDHVLRERIAQHYRKMGDRFISIAQRQKWKSFVRKRRAGSSGSK
jgi:DNA-binding GntR family transcriptional regulator